MATPGERKALLFLATVAVLGAGVRVVRAARAGDSADSASQTSLRDHLAVVEAARAGARPRGASASGRAARPEGIGAPDATAPGATPDDDAPLVDVDVATAEELDRLPRIGPALARRIVADRDSLGPFGSLEALQRVKGIGPALAKLLAPRVTFSRKTSQMSAAANRSLALREPSPADLSATASPPLRTMAAPQIATSAERIGELLVAEGLITREQLQKGVVEARASQSRIGAALVKLGFVPEPDLTRVLARQFRMPAVDLATFTPDAKIVKLIPADLATKHIVFPLVREGRTLTVAVADPTNLGVLEDLQFITSYAIAPVLAGEASIRRLIEKHYESADAALQTILADLADEEPDLELVETTEEEAALDAGMDEAPVVRMINAILIDAVKRGASDIHFECFEHEVRVRYRIDGALLEVMRPPLKMRPALISRFKIMAQLNIAERRVPQDGRIKLKMGRRVIDFRVSTLPTLFGEKVVLRILDKGNLTLDLETFGIEPRAEQDLMQAISNPYGMVLVTGPTGSGKTTTLYSALSKINNIDTNIMTAEDPVEYNLFGINQVQVRPDIGMTFAASLRAFLRQDPNVIMVGEVRDLETGGIAIKAALTGHLVLSTLHTNSAAETVTRLLDMGLEPFNVASALNLVLAQRLVRRICSHCRERYVPDDEELKTLKVKSTTTLAELRLTEEPLRNAKSRATPEVAAMLGNLSPKTTISELPFFKGRGCERCGGNGLKGRQGLYEVMAMSPAVRKLVMQNGDAVEIRDTAISEGMLTLRMDGWLKILKGLTTTEQVLRETAA